jgi:hypothetical protein
LRNVEIDSFAAQAPSDVPHLLRFYQSHFRHQGSFPVLERSLKVQAEPVKQTSATPAS